MKLIFLGSQGSGKSTQAQLLAAKLKLPWIEMGHLFRQKAHGAPEAAAEIRKALAVGDLVPDNLAIETLVERLSKADCALGYVLDGYPRNFAQLEGLDKNIDKVFYIKVSNEEVIKRLLKRARADDTLKILARRLNLYHHQTEPLLSYFKEEGILEEIDGERPIEVIAKEIEKKVYDDKE